MKFTSREQILASAFTPYEKGRLLEEFDQINPKLPPPPPKPDAVERGQLAAIAKSLATARDEFRTLESRADKYNQELPGLQDRLAALKSATPPDAPMDSILRLLVEERRVHIMREFLANVSQRREEISRRIGNDFSRVNDLILKFGNQQFFLSGARPELNAQAAISAIETLLR